MPNVGYFKFPRELLVSSNWKSLSLEYRHIFITILANVAYESTTQNDHGKIININPGQMLVTYRELVRLCDEKEIDLPKIQRALKRFNEIGFSIHKTIHVKTLITIKEPITCKIWFESNDTKNDTKNDTRTIQERYTKEEVKKERNEEDIISREALNQKIVGLDFVNENFENPSPELNTPVITNSFCKHNVYIQTNTTETNSTKNIEKETKVKQKPNKESSPKITFRPEVKLTQSEYDKLLGEHGQESLDWMLDKLNNHKCASGKRYKSDYHAILTWVVDAYSKSRNPQAQGPPSRAYMNGKRMEEYDKIF